MGTKHTALLQDISEYNDTLLSQSTGSCKQNGALQNLILNEESTSCIEQIPMFDNILKNVKVLKVFHYFYIYREPRSDRGCM